MKQKNQNIDDLIKKSFDDSGDDFDFSGWDKVHENLEQTSTLDHLVKTAFNQPVSDVPKSSWNVVHDALDIETVWNRLSQEPSRKPVLWWNAAVFLMFLTLGTVMLYQLFQTDRSIESYSESVPPQHFSDNSIRVLIRSEFYSFNKSFKPAESSLANQNLSLINVQPIEDLSIELYSKSQEPENEADVVPGEVSDFSTNSLPFNNNSQQKQSLQYLETFGPQAILIPLTLTNIIQPPNQDSSSYVSSSKEEESYKWQLGISTSFDNTWILDSRSREGLNESSLVFNTIAYSPSFGVFSTYSIKPKYSVTADVFFLNTQKTKTNHYLNGNINLKETSLEYLKNSLLLNVKIPFNKVITDKYLLLSGGAYFSYLKRNTIKDNGIITSINSNFKDFDLGTKMSIALQKEGKRLVFNLGVHLDYGLINIYSGSDRLPAHLNQTRNISWGILGRMGYKF